MTHEDLRKLAVSWLTGAKKCSVILSEIVTAAGEIPDAVGWKYAGSITVECKATRSDFLRNGQKCHERRGDCIGQQRYFLCPPGIIEAKDVEGTGWGLLYAGDRIKTIVEAERRKSNERGEIAMLCSALRRVRTREFLTIVLADQGPTCGGVARKGKSARKEG